MQVREFQTLIHELYFEKDKARGSEATFLWLAEEVGELAKSMRRKDFFNMREELADVVAWTASLANLYGIDLADALREKYPGRCGVCSSIPCRCVEETRALGGTG